MENQQHYFSATYPPQSEMVISGMQMSEAEIEAQLTLAIKGLAMQIAALRNCRVKDVRINLELIP